MIRNKDNSALASLLIVLTSSLSPKGKMKLRQIQEHFIDNKIKKCKQGPDYPFLLSYVGI